MNYELILPFISTESVMIEFDRWHDECLNVIFVIWGYQGFRGDIWTDSNLKRYFSFNLVKEKKYIKKYILLINCQFCVFNICSNCYTYTTQRFGVWKFLKDVSCAQQDCIYLIKIQKTCFYLNIFSNIFYSCDAKLIFSIITPVFSVTWSSEIILVW